MIQAQYFHDGAHAVTTHVASISEAVRSHLDAGFVIHETHRGRYHGQSRFHVYFTRPDAYLYGTCARTSTIVFVA
jgi:hypothetical protein